MNPQDFNNEPSKTQPRTNDKSYFTRSTTKRFSEYRPRSNINIRPINFDEELKEIENEPLPEIHFEEELKDIEEELIEAKNEPLPENVCDYSEDSQIETGLNLNNKIEDECRGTTKEKNVITEAQPAEIHDSFDIDFGMLSLVTPVKGSKPSTLVDNKDTLLPPPSSERCTKAVTFSDSSKGFLSLETPVKTSKPSIMIDNRNMLLPPPPGKKSNEGLKFTEEPLKTGNTRFATPKFSKVPPNPKIQCSVDVKSYLNNPIAPRGIHQQIMQKPNDTFATPGGKSSSQNNPKEVSTENRLENVKNKIQVTIPAKNLFVRDLFQKVVVNNVEYIILKLLGRGGSSQVFHCYDLRATNNRAIKCVSLNNPESATGFINEVKLLHKLQKCDRIIKMYDYEIRESEKQLYVVLEMGGSDLARILKELASNTSHVPLYVLIFYWMEMLYAVKQIHSTGIIHSDLKPANFLKAEGGLKLIDFGIATCIQSDMTSVLKTVTEGSFNYISPEAIMDESNRQNTAKTSKPSYKISYKSDVWSLGCILYQLVYRKTPFQHISNMWMKLATLGNPKHVIEYPEANWVPKRILDTIKKCLQYEMKARPSIDDLIAEYENIFHDMR